jgi:tungstate transport system substrate-binding protein
MPFDGPRIPRRSFLKFATTALAAGPALISRGALAAATATRLLRVASVTTAVEGGALPTLAEAFEKETGLHVEITAGDDPHHQAESGLADLVVSHFGHRDTERFVLKGFGLWPRTVFSNQLGLLGPPADPAKVRGLPSLVQAFRQIAKAKAPFVANETHGLRYLTKILWYAAGQPPKGPWFIDPGISKSDAMALAAERGAYVFWGLTPFLRDQKAAHRALEPLVTSDPLLQRLMVSIVVNAERVPGANAVGAAKFQEFLLLPRTQARIMEIHYPGIGQAVWAPAGRHNPGSVLPD